MRHYLTLAEAVEIVPVSEITLRRAIRTGELTAFRPATKILIRPDDLKAWVESKPAARPSPPMPRPRRRTKPGSLLDRVMAEREEAA